MNIQSISIVVPTKGCVNNCKMCVSRMHDNPYCDKFDEIQYRKRIKYAARNGVNTLILTGTGEVLQNGNFLRKLKVVLDKEGHPFPNVEIQTTGVMLTHSEFVKDEDSGHPVNYYYNIQLLKELGVNTISLSISDIFDGKNNWDIIGAPKKLQIDLNHLCEFIKEQGFNLRMSLNMTNVYDKQYPEDILMQCKMLRADQITFRKLYGGGVDTPESIWVDDNAAHETVFTRIFEYIAGERDSEFQEWCDNGEGTPLYRLPFGAMVYSIDGMSVAIDDNCMGKDNNEDLKYVILRENGKLYCQWDDEGSLIF